LGARIWQTTLSNFDFKPLGLAIKEARLSKGLTRERVGSMIQIAPRYLTNIENKGQQPSFHVVYDLVTLLNISLDGFILGEENSHKSSKRLQVEAQLDCLDEDELVTIGKMIQAIYGEKCKFN
jgi:transcriptional regulator with XRE-family HTH domain